MTHTPEFELTKEEAHNLAAGIAEVSRHYPIPAMKPEHVALAMLGAITWKTYSPKFRAINARKRGEKRQIEQPPASAPTVGGNTVPVMPTAQDIPPVSNWFDLGSGGQPN